MPTQINKGVVMGFVSVHAKSGKTTLIKMVAHLLNKHSTRRNKDFRGIIIDLPGLGFAPPSKRISSDGEYINDLELALVSVYYAKCDNHPSLWSGEIDFRGGKRGKESLKEKTSSDLNKELGKYIKPYMKPRIDILSNRPSFPGLDKSSGEIAFIFSQLPSLIDKLRQAYRFILIEMPSSYAIYDVLTMELLSKINHVIIPFGMDQSLKLIRELDIIDKMVKELSDLEQPIAISSIIPMFYNDRDAIHSNTLVVLREKFRKLIGPSIPYKSGKSSRQIVGLHEKIFQKFSGLIAQPPPIRSKMMIARGKLIDRAMTEIENNYLESPEVSPSSLKEISLNKSLSLSSITSYINKYYQIEEEMTEDKIRGALSRSIFKNYFWVCCEDAVVNAWLSGAKAMKLLDEN